MKLKALICLALISFPAHGQLPGLGASFLEPEKVVNVAIVLPFNSNGKASDNYIDFYCGALLAAKDAAASGMLLSVDVYDTAQGAKPVTAADLNRSDIIIGPVSVPDILKVLEILPDDKYMISPLEQKAEQLASDRRVIQIPTPQDAQTRDLVRWIAADCCDGDRVVVVCDPASVGSQFYNTVTEELSRQWISYQVLSYNARNDDSNQPRFEACADSCHTTRFLIASENEAFVNDIVRNANLLSFKRYDVELYGQSKVRSYESIDVEYLHRCKLNTVNRYYVDYKSDRVKEFVGNFRRTFLGEPNSFAFQGYDVMTHFIKARKQAGTDWLDIFSVPSKGLQLNFLFSAQEGGGAVNTAVRRVSFLPDYSITLR